MDLQQESICDTQVVMEPLRIVASFALSKGSRIQPSKSRRSLTMVLGSSDTSYVGMGASLHTAVRHKNCSD